MKTFEDQSLTDINQELNVVFGTKKSSRISKSRVNNAVGVSTNVFDNISFSCTYLFLYKYLIYHNIIYHKYNYHYIIIIIFFIADVMQSSFSQISEFLVYLPLGCNRFSNKLETVYPVSTLLLENEVDLMTDYAKEVISMLPISNDNEE